MCQSSSLTAFLPRQDDYSSVYQFGELEAQRFKWIESEKAGKDLGDSAIRCWVRKHWHGFVRARWLEHLQGRRYWIELDQGDFGLLLDAFRDSQLIQEIIQILKAGGENLDLVNWAIDRRLPRHELDEVLEILEILDINSRRLEFLLDVRLSHAS